MKELPALISAFNASVVSEKIEIYNEFSLQHELGIFLQHALPGMKVQFERNISHFTSSKAGFTKRELDIVVFSENKADLRFAIELKFPRSGQYPEQMFSFCRDIAFIEELKDLGFKETALLVYVDDRLFHQGAAEGIYAHFRGSLPITGNIRKPTGAKNEFVTIKRSHLVQWLPVTSTIHQALVHIANDA